MDKNTNLNAIIFRDDIWVHQLPSRRMPRINRDSGLWIFNWARDFVSRSPSGNGLRCFEFYCIAHLLKGRGIYRRGDDEPVELEPGMCVLVSPGVRHHYGALPGCQFVEDTVNFCGPAADLMFKSGLFKDGVYRIGTAPVLRQVMELAADPSEHFQLNAEFVLREILQNIYNETFSRDGTDAVEQGMIVPLLEAVKKHPEKDWSVSSMAEFCGMSVNGFRDKFRRRTGVLPKVYLDRYRMGLAASLLIGSPLSAGEIAGRCGYSDPFHFSRRFKSVTGLSPVNYRKRFSKNT